MLCQATNRQLSMLLTKETIDVFIKMLERLCGYLRDEETAFEQVYFYSSCTVKTERKKGHNICVLISEKYEEFGVQNYLRLMRANGKEYIVYQLPKQIVGEPNIDDSILYRAGLICDYLDRHFEKETVRVVLDGKLSEKKKQNYAILLFHEHFRHVCRMENQEVRSAVKSLFEITYVAKERDEKLMALEPEQVVIPDGERSE